VDWGIVYAFCSGEDSALVYNILVLGNKGVDFQNPLYDYMTKNNYFLG